MIKTLFFVALLSCSCYVSLSQRPQVISTTAAWNNETEILNLVAASVANENGEFFYEIGDDDQDNEGTFVFGEYVVDVDWNTEPNTQGGLNFNIDNVESNSEFARNVALNTIVGLQANPDAILNNTNATLAQAALNAPTNAAQAADSAADSAAAASAAAATAAAAAVAANNTDTAAVDTADNDNSDNDIAAGAAVPVIGSTAAQAPANNEATPVIGSTAAQAPANNEAAPVVGDTAAQAPDNNAAAPVVVRNTTVVNPPNQGAADQTVAAAVAAADNAADDSTL